MNYKCPFCGEILTEDEAESVCDCGCPSCRRAFDVELYQIEYETEVAPEA